MRIELLYPILVVILTSTAWGRPELKHDLNLGSADILEDNLEESEPSLVKFRFEQEIGKLESLLTPNRDSLSKVGLLKETLKDIQNVRDSLEMADIDEEVYMDIVVRSLDELPDARDFQPRRCPAYQNQMLVNFEPTAGDTEPIDPAVKRAFKILQKICE
jgi:hypothetical protein